MKEPEMSDSNPITKDVMPWELMTRLSTEGGAIVREEDLSAEDLEKAKAEGRHWGGFVYEPIEE